MTTALLTRPRDRSWRPVAGLLAVAGLALLALVRTNGGRAPVATDEERVAAYVAALGRIGTEGGEIVADGMMPGLADIAQQRYPDDVLVRMATGWAVSMRDVRRELTALEVPPTLSAVAVQFERALTAYVHAAETLQDAAYAHGDERAVLVDRAAGLGHEADRLYDGAVSALAEATR